MKPEMKAKLEAAKCACGNLYCRQDHSICIKCGQKNNMDAKPNRCPKGKRHLYSF